MQRLGWWLLNTLHLPQELDKFMNGFVKKKKLPSRLIVPPKPIEQPTQTVEPARADGPAPQPTP